MVVSSLEESEVGEVRQKWAVEEEDEEEDSDGSVLTHLLEIDSLPEMVSDEVKVSASLSASCTPPLITILVALVL